MSGDDLAIFLFFVSLALPAFGLEAMKAETLPRRVTFGTLSVACLLMAVFWLQIKPLWEPFTAHVTRVATNPVAWFCVFMFALAAFAFHKPKGQRAIESSPTALPPPKTEVKAVAPPPPPPPPPVVSNADTPAPVVTNEREFVDITPEYLYGLGRKGLTNVQTGLIIKPLLGKWMRIRGLVLQVSERVVVIRSENEPDLLLPYVIALEIDDEWKPRFHLLEKNKKITVIGQIFGVDQIQLTLQHCEIV